MKFFKILRLTCKQLSLVVFFLACFFLTPSAGYADECGAINDINESNVSNVVNTVKAIGTASLCLSTGLQCLDRPTKLISAALLKMKTFQWEKPFSLKISSGPHFSTYKHRFVDDAVKPIKVDLVCITIEKVEKNPQ